MAYCHFEDQDQIIVSTKIAHTPDSLVDFLVGSFLNSGGDLSSAATNNSYGGSYSSCGGGSDSQGYEQISNVNTTSSDLEMSPLLASQQALEVLENSISLLKNQIHLMHQHSAEEGLSSEIDNERQTVKLLQQYQSVVFNVSPRVTKMNKK
jgi:hypothetical protein